MIQLPAVVLCVSTLASPMQAAQAAAAATPPQPRPTASDPVAWHDGPLDDALAEAGRRGTLALVYFWMQGSTHCTRLYGETLTSAEAGAALRDLIGVSADAADPRGARLIQRFHVTTLPTLLLVTPAGVVEDAVLGYIPTPALISELQRIRAGTQTVSALRARADAAPDDLAHRFRLALKLDFVGDRETSGALLDSIRRADPRGRTEGGAELLLADVRAAMVRAAADPNDPATYDSTALRRLCPRLGHAGVRFKAWSGLASIELACGQRRQARASYEAAWRDIPPAQLALWPATTTLTYWAMRAELATRDKRLCLEFAQAALRAAEAATQPAQGAPSAPSASTEQRALALRALACAYALNRKPDKAAAALDRALALEPENEELLRLRAELAR